MKKIISIFQGILIAVGVCAILLFLIPMLIGITPSIVLSGSMEDEIKTGAIVYSNTHVKVEDIQVGDVILYQLGTNQVTHRVTKINSNKTFTTKGDANENVDLSPVPFENYKGKVMFSIPYLGILVKNINTRIGYFIIFTIIGINILIGILYNSNTQKKDN